MAEKRESNIKAGHVNYKCLDCGQISKRYLSKQEYYEVTACPNCEGKSVDLYKIAKYKTDEKPSNSLKIKIDVDCTEALKGLKAVTRAAKKATVALKELEEQQKKIEVAIPLNVDGESISKAIFDVLRNDRLRDGIKC